MISKSVMKSVVVLFVFSVFGGCGGGSSSSGGEPDFASITVEGASPDALHGSHGTGAGGHRTIYAKALVDGIDDPAVPDELNDFFIMDIRLPGDYCNGHIPGAVNIPFLEVAKPANLIKLPTDKPILVVCYTGHTASQTNAILNMLGYDAWTLRFGMTSWVSSSGTKVWSSSTSQDVYGAGYAVEKCATN